MQLNVKFKARDLVIRGLRAAFLFLLFLSNAIPPLLFNVPIALNIGASMPTETKGYAYRYNFFPCKLLSKFPGNYTALSHTTTFPKALLQETKAGFLHEQHHLPGTRECRVLAFAYAFACLELTASAFKTESFFL